MPTLTIAGIVLCGGASRRMGRDKASLPFGCETMLQRVVRQMSAVVRPVVVVAADGQSVPSLSNDVAVLRDAVADRGPWQGISTGLHFLKGKADAAFVRSVDSPFLAPGWVTRLADLLDANLCAIPLANGHRQPMAGLYRIEAAEAIDRLLAVRSNRPWSLFDLVPTRCVDEDQLRDIDPRLQTLRNINTPEDYQLALADADPFFREPRK